jgi:hypothetical protein
VSGLGIVDDNPLIEKDATVIDTPLGRHFKIQTIPRTRLNTALAVVDKAQLEHLPIETIFLETK